MTWLHQCRLPGPLSIRLRRARPEARYACKCGRVFTLEQRVVEHTGVMFWRWSPPEERESQDVGEQQPGGAHAVTELTDRDPGSDDGGYQYRPEIQLGFRRNDD